MKEMSYYYLDVMDFGPGVDTRICKRWHTCWYAEFHHITIGTVRMYAN